MRMSSQFLHSVYQKNPRLMTGSKQQILVSVAIVSLNHNLQPSAPQMFYLRHVRSLMKVRIYKWVTRWSYLFLRNAWGRRHAWTNCLIDFAFPLKDVRSVLTSPSLKTWLVQWDKNVDALFQQMRNDKCINHSASFSVMGSAWHSLGLFGDSSPRNWFLIHHWLHQMYQTAVVVYPLYKKKNAFWKA